MSIAIRPFTPAKAEALAALWVEAWSHTMPGINFEDRKPWLLARLEEFSERNISIAIAEVSEGGTPLGFLTLDPCSGELDQIAVARLHWGTGVLKALLDHAKSHAPGVLWLTVNRDNPRAIAAYEREGFRKSGEGVNPASGLPTLMYRWEKTPVPGP